MKLAPYCLDVAVIVGYPYRRGRSALQRRGAAAQRSHRARLLQAEAPQLPRLRRSAIRDRRQAQPVFEVDGPQGGHHHLRGPVVPGARRAGEGRGRGAAHLDQRLALQPLATGRALHAHGRAREGDEAAAAVRARHRGQDELVFDGASFASTARAWSPTRPRPSANRWTSSTSPAGRWRAPWPSRSRRRRSSTARS